MHMRKCRLHHTQANIKFCHMKQKNKLGAARARTARPRGESLASFLERRGRDECRLSKGRGALLDPGTRGQGALQGARGHV